MKRTKARSPKVCRKCGCLIPSGTFYTRINAFAAECLTCPDSTIKPNSADSKCYLGEFCYL